MRVFNVRLAAILLAIVVVFGIGAYFLNGYQVSATPIFFLDEAQRAEQRSCGGR